LAREDHIKSLLQWVVAGLDELDQQAEQSDIESFEYAVASFPSYSQQVRPVPAPGPGSPPLEPAKMADGAEDEAPYSPDLPAGLGQGLETKGGDDTAKRIR
jgi:SIT4-associating protein SAP185/190